MNRRAFLRLGVVGVGSALTGCSSREQTERQPTTTRAGPPTEPPATDRAGSSSTVPYAGRYRTVVDLASRGADRSGERSVVPLLHELAGDDTLLYFPPGRYMVDEPFRVFDFERLGIVGSDATITTPAGNSSILFDIGRPGRASDFLVEGLEFDIRAANTGPRPLSLLVGGRLVVRDVTVVGRQDAGWGMIRLDVTEPDGEGIVERLRLPDGATSTTQSTGCLVGQEHRGRITFRDCTIVGFPDNGLYAEPDHGSVQVIGGYYSNNGIASLRVGNNSVVRGARIVCDHASPGFSNMRGIRLREGRDVLVEGCTIELLEVTGSDGALVLAPWLESATIRDTTIRVDADGVAAFLAKSPAGDGPASNILCEGLTVVGNASYGAAIEVHDRDGCTFHDTYVLQTGADRDGFQFRRTRGATLTDTQVLVTGRPLTTRNSSVRREGVTLRRVDSESGPATTPRDAS